MRDFWVKNISEHIWKHKERLITSSRSLLFFLTTLTDWVQWKKWNHIFEEFWLSLTKYLTHERVSYMDWLFCTNHHNIRFNICFPCLHGLVGFLLKTSKYLCLSISLLAFLSFKSSRITSLQVFLGRPLGKLPLSLKFLYALDQALSPILSRWPTHYSLLSFKDSLILSILV